MVAVTRSVRPAPLRSSGADLAIGALPIASRKRQVLRRKCACQFVQAPHNIGRLRAPCVNCNMATATAAQRAAGCLHTARQQHYRCDAMLCLPTHWNLMSLYLVTTMTSRGPPSSGRQQSSVMSRFDGPTAWNGPPASTADVNAFGRCARIGVSGLAYYYTTCLCSGDQEVWKDGGVGGRLGG